MEIKRLATRAKFADFQSLLLLSIAFLGLCCSAFADFPPILVIDGSAYSGAQVTGTGGETYSKYLASGGVVVLRGANGGTAGWGANEAAALANQNGSWNGGNSVTIPGKTIVVPQIVVSYASVTTPAVMKCYDGTERNAIGTGTDVAGRFMVAYNGLSDGVIFNFGNNTEFYRFQAGPGPIVLNVAQSWPSSNIALFPAQLVFNGHTFTVNSFTQGFGNGYWSHVYYHGSTGDGELHSYIAGNGSSGEMWGIIENTNVHAAWDPAVKRFIADPTLGVTLSPSSSAPSYGPPGVEWDGVFLEFRYTDTYGSDVYSDRAGSLWVVVGSDGMTTASSIYTTQSGTYDGATQMFSFSGDLAAVNAQGTEFIDTQGTWFFIYTNGWEVDLINILISWDWMTVYHEHKLCRVDGTAVFAYRWDACYGGSVIDCGGYYWIGNLDFTHGQPPRLDFPPLPDIPSVVYLNNREFTGGGSGSSGWWYNEYQYQFWSGGDSLYIYATNTIFGDRQVSWNAYIDNESISGNWYEAEMNWYSTDGNYCLSFAPISSSFGPPKIIWNRNSYLFGYNNPSNSFSYYQDLTENWITIDQNGTVTLGGTYSAVGTYNPTTYRFSFANSFNISNFAAQDSNGDLLGAPKGLTIIAQNSSAHPLVLGSGTTRQPNYTFQRTDAIFCSKYVGLPENSLLVVANDSGAFTSPIYRYRTGTEEFKIEVDASGHWTESNFYPNQLYLNGHYVFRDDSAIHTSGTIPARSGDVTYNIGDGSGHVTLSWTWNQTGFAATVSGEYQTEYSEAKTLTGNWDGNRLITNLPDGVVISFDPPVSAVRYGPAQLEWNGVRLTLDPIASSVSGSNPNGRDVYKDSQGLSLSVSIGLDGSVTVSNGNGLVLNGTYSALNGQFNFGGQDAGVLKALDNNGCPIDRNTGNGDAAGEPVSEILGNFDIHGNWLTLGSWIDGQGDSVAGLALGFTPAQSGEAASSIDFSASRKLVQWTWSHAELDSGTNRVPSMKVDSKNRLTLYDPQPQTTGSANQPTVIIDPSSSGTSQFSGTVKMKGPILIEPQGDLSMGDFTTGSSPQ